MPNEPEDDCSDDSQQTVKIIKEVSSPVEQADHEWHDAVTDFTNLAEGVYRRCVAGHHISDLTMETLRKGYREWEEAEDEEEAKATSFFSSARACLMSQDGTPDHKDAQSEDEIEAQKQGIGILKRAIDAYETREPGQCVDTITIPVSILTLNRSLGFMYNETWKYRRSLGEAKTGVDEVNKALSQLLLETTDSGTSGPSTVTEHEQTGDRGIRH